MKIRRSLLLTASLVAALCVSTASPVAANAGTVTTSTFTPPATVSGSIFSSVAAGTVTTSTFTPPATVNGATLGSVFSDGEGGTYQIFRSGQTRTMIRVLGTGSVDTAFNSNTPVAIGVPPNLQSSDVIRQGGAVNVATKKWWTVTSPQTSNTLVTNGITIASGDSKGTVSFTKNIGGATLKSKCDEFIANTTVIQNPSFLARRGGGMWLSLLCGSNNAQVLFPLTQSGDFDSSAASVSLVAAHGSSAICTVQVRAIADPTSKAPAPELWVLRGEHNFQANSSCPTNTNLASSIASNYVALAGLSITENGTVTRRVLSTSPLLPGGMRIDPGGRVVALLSEVADATNLKVIRLNASGAVDTTVGTDGFRDVPTGALPAGATQMFTSIIGVVTTAERTYFVVSLVDGEVNSYLNNSTTPRVHGVRMGLLSPVDGWATGFGTNGIGTRATTTLPENWFGNGGITFTGSVVNSKGQPTVFSFGETSISYNVWAAIAGATGGGDGGTGLGGFTRDTGGAPSAGDNGSATGRIDTKVYTRLPSTVQINTAFTVLSPTQATTQTLTSNTGNTCAVSGSHVVAIATGRCNVTVTRKTDKKVLRILRTTVGKKLSTLGSEVNVSDPITFSIASARLSSTARTQIAEIATSAANAKAVVVVGHAAALTESRFNFAISRKRADAVRRALQRANVAAPVTATARGTSQQISRKKTEAAQAQNRRVVVYLIP